MLKRQAIKKKDYKLKKSPLKRGNSSLKKSPIKKRIKSEEELEEERYQRLKMNIFFWECWESLPKYSEINPFYKFNDANKTHYHHLYPKSIYPELRYSLNNIICVSWEEHSLLDNDLEYFEEAKKKRIFIKENWEMCIEESKLWSETYDKINKKYE